MYERRIKGFLLAVFAAIAAVAIGTSYYSVSRIEQRLSDASDFHTESLFQLLTLNETFVKAVQESLAYLASGEESDLQEFHVLNEKFDEESRRFAEVAKLPSAGEEVEQAMFQDIASGYRRLRAAASMMFREYETSAAVSSDTYLEYEELVDILVRQFDALIRVEEGEVEAAQAMALAAIDEAKGLTQLQGIVVVALTLLAAVLVMRELRRALKARDEAEQEARLHRQAVEAAGIGMMFADAAVAGYPLVYVNPAFSEITGYAPHEVNGRSCSFLQGEDTDASRIDKLANALRNKQPVKMLILNYRKNGNAFWNDLSISPVLGDAGVVTHFVGSLNDVTERISIQRQLQQSQKMDAVGQLAGGLAHDLNNYLTVINGAAELLADDKGADVSYWTGQIMAAGERCSALTRQLLAFARRQVLEPRVLDLNAVVQSILPLLRGTLREDIVLATVLADDLGLVNVDSSQLEQVITNLVLNARDAMPRGGAITIETGDVFLGEGYAATHPGVTPGRHAMLAVSDDGTGIDPAIMDKVFEPFVSTKNPGKGTGLGLATVYGIVEQSGGTLRYSSEPGRGTTFKIYFRCDEEATRNEVEQPLTAEINGAGILLLVEDEAVVRSVTRAMLKAMGFEVLEAQNGVAALAILEARQDVELILTDVTMPEMGGIELARRAREMHPGIKVVFMSGYAKNGIEHQGAFDEDHVLVQKPFTRSDLNAGLARIMKNLPAR